MKTHCWTLPMQFLKRLEINIFHVKAKHLALVLPACPVLENFSIQSSSFRTTRVFSGILKHGNKTHLNTIRVSNSRMSLDPTLTKENSIPFAPHVRSVRFMEAYFLSKLNMYYYMLAVPNTWIRVHSPEMQVKLIYELEDLISKQKSGSLAVIEGYSTEKIIKELGLEAVAGSMSHAEKDNAVQEIISKECEYLVEPDYEEEPDED